MKPWLCRRKRNLLNGGFDVTRRRLRRLTSSSSSLSWVGARSKTKLLKFAVYTFIFRPMFASLRRDSSRARERRASSGKYGSIEGDEKRLVYLVAAPRWLPGQRRKKFHGVGRKRSRVYLGRFRRGIFYFKTGKFREEPIVPSEDAGTSIRSGCLRYGTWEGGSRVDALIVQHREIGFVFGYRWWVVLGLCWLVVSNGSLQAMMLQAEVLLKRYSSSKTLFATENCRMAIWAWYCINILHKLYFTSFGIFDTIN